MTQYSKINVIYRLQRWIDSVPGQTFLNYAYSWGAAVVILGTLFKLTHLPGANLMLYIGMGTEVVVFFISAFDRPFDKTAIGMELPTSLSAGKAAEPVPQAETPCAGARDTAYQGATQAVPQGAGQAAGGQQTVFVAAAAPQPSPEMQEATDRYVEELRRLTDTLARVSAQSAGIEGETEELSSLNRTLTGITRVYEMQLKSASSQIGTIDQINEQSRKMAQLIEQLNNIYARMIDAMTVNMAVTGAQNTARQA